MDHLYKYFRWLSLDIVLGAIFFLLYLERYYALEFSVHVYLALGSAIWLIYTTDHLIDAWKVTAPTSDRHRFHKKHFSSLVLAAGSILSLSLGNIYFLEVEIIRNGALLSAACILYLMLVYFFKALWVKEILVALAYAGGIFLAPLSITGMEFLDFILWLQLAGIAFLNLLVFSSYDQASDRQDGFNSLVIRLGNGKAQHVVWITAVSLLISGGWIYFQRGEAIQLLFVMMTALLIWVHVSPGYFSRSERFRVVGDGVFYLSGLFLLL